MGSFVALMGWLPAMALALVPPKLAYQGRLLDPTGAPVAGLQEIRFTIYDSVSGGNALWSEVQRLSLTDGYYATYLGAADSTNLAKAFEGGGERYLSLTIGGTELLPRQSIASVPYAMSCGTAAKVADAPPPSGRNLIQWSSSVARWSPLGTPALTIAQNNEDVLEGEASFTFTIAAGGSGAAATFGDFIAVDPSRRYEGHIAAKLVAGAGPFSAGYQAFDAKKTPLPGNSGGASTYGGFIADAVALTQGAWMRFSGTVSGEGAAVGAFPAGTRFVKPLVVVNANNVGTTILSSFQIFEIGEEQTYMYSGAFSTPTEWEADLLARGNYARFCQAIGRSFVRANELVSHYNPGRTNGYIYDGWFYAGKRLCDGDIFYNGNRDPANEYSVWQYKSGCGCCVLSASWTFERRALITCR